MKKILLLALPISILISCKSTKNNLGFQGKSDWEMQNLYSKVKSMQTKTYEAIQTPDGIKKGKRKGTINFTIEFNKKGYRTEHKNLNTLGEIANINYYKYDKKNNLIEMNKYTKNNILISTDLFQYDKNNNRIELRTLKSNGDLEFKANYKYNGKGQNIEIIKFHSNRPSKNITKALRTYDEKGNVIEINLYLPNGEFLSKSTFKSDAKGKITEFLGYDRNKNLDFKLNNTYDSYGNEIEKRFSQLIVSFQYFFDKNNNWTKRIQFNNKIPTEVIEREIVYY